MNYEDVEKLSNAAKGKINLLNSNFMKYFLRAVMAGFFIDAAMIFSNVVGNIFSSNGSPEWGKFLGGLVFALAVLLISFVGGELFTGNNMVMAFGAYDKKVSWADVGKVWGISYLGNFVGCVILAVIFAWAGASGTADYYAGFIPGKLSLPVGTMFCRAILCNFFVCLGVLCGMKLKSEAGRFLMIVMCISAFVISGFEHCIANMGNFVTALMLVDGLSIGSMLKSMVVVTLGNMVGGAVLLAWPLRKMSADK
jgi:nitrite transporter NirC